MPDRLRLVLACALLVPVLALGLEGPATAAGETCQGVPATIVGTPGGQVLGTPGDDVIVTNGARRVDGEAGDDLICTTGTNAPRRLLVSFTGGTGTNVIAVSYTHLTLPTNREV